MLRTARSIEAGTVYHVLNRGNGRMRLFHKDGDYEAFERVLTEGVDRYPVFTRWGDWSFYPRQVEPGVTGWQSVGAGAEMGSRTVKVAPLPLVLGR